MTTLPRVPPRVPSTCGACLRSQGKRGSPASWRAHKRTMSIIHSGFHSGSTAAPQRLRTNRNRLNPSWHSLWPTAYLAGQAPHPQPRTNAPERSARWPPPGGSAPVQAVSARRGAACSRVRGVTSTRCSRRAAPLDLPAVRLPCGRHRSPRRRRSRQRHAARRWRCSSRRRPHRRHRPVMEIVVSSSDPRRTARRMRGW